MRLGPSDHGRPIRPEEFATARAREGYEYELIDGRVYVSRFPEMGLVFLGEWLLDAFFFYRESHPGVIRYLSRKARVFVPGRPGVTSPSPDVTVYTDFPTDRPIRELNWEDVSPSIVAEVIADDDPD
jgi:hypothetical protein